MNLLALCVLLASCSGLCGSLAALAISYPVHHNEGKPLEGASHCISLVGNLALTGMQVGLGFLATKFGSVSVVMPLSVGAALFSNMILQQSLRIARFTNASITGTLVLVVAIMMLPQLGPLEPKDSEQLDVLGLLLAPQAIGFIVASLMACFGSLVMLLRSDKIPNFTMLLLFSMVGGSGTVLNCSIQKMLMSEPPALLAGGLLGCYILLSILCLGSGAMANGTLQDASLFVPINNALNLFLNFLAGLFIWQDLEHVEYPFSYFMVYSLVGLGSYLVSSVDMFALLQPNYDQHRVQHIPVIKDVYMHTPGLRKMVTRGKLGDAMDPLKPRRRKNNHLHPGKELVSIRDRDHFENQFKYELERLLSPAEVAFLVTELLHSTGSFVTGQPDNQVLQSWVDNLRPRKFVRGQNGSFAEFVGVSSYLTTSRPGTAAPVAV